jgi:DNA primase
LADEFGIDHQAVLDDYRRNQSGTGSVKKGEQAGNKQLKMNGELLLLSAVFVHPEFFKDLRAKLSVEDLDDPHAKELFIILEERFRTSDFTDLADPRGGDPMLFNGVGEDLRDFIIRQNASGAFFNAEGILNDGIARVQVKVLERRRKEIIRFLHSPDLPGVRQDDLLAEKIHIDSEFLDLRKRTHEQ